MYDALHKYDLMLLMLLLEGRDRKPNMWDYNLKYVGCFSFLHEFWGIAVFPQLICMNIMQEKPEIPRFLVDSPDFHS